MANELLDRMRKQAEKLGAEINYLEEVIELDLGQELKKVISGKTTYKSQALVIATGTQRRKLNVPGETRLIGRGVNYCRVCDAPFYKGLKVAVIGSKKDAINDALHLSEIAREVLLLTQNGKISVQNELMNKFREKTNVKIIRGRVINILGEHFVEAIEIKRENNKDLIERVNGVFVSLGKTPATEIFEKAGVAVDERGCVKVDRWQGTNIEGVFAAGDCTCGGMQVVTAVGEGAMASLKAMEYIRRLKEGSRNF